MTKQVQFSDEAYARLAAQKLEGESFSDVVLRLTQRRSLAEVLPKRSKAAANAHLRRLRDLAALDLADARAHARRADRARRGH